MRRTHCPGHLDLFSSLHLADIEAVALAMVLVELKQYEKVPRAGHAAREHASPIVAQYGRLAITVSLFQTVKRYRFTV